MDPHNFHRSPTSGSTSGLMRMSTRARSPVASAAKLPRKGGGGGGGSVCVCGGRSSGKRADIYGEVIIRHHQHNYSIEVMQGGGEEIAHRMLARSNSESTLMRAPTCTA